MLDGRGDALRAYAWRGDIAGIDKMLKRGASIDDADTLDGPPLAVAAASPRAGIETMAFLLDRGAAIDFGGTECEKPALFAAASVGDEQKVRFLLERGADARLRTVRGYGVMLSAVSGCLLRGHEIGMPIIRALQAAGGRLDAMSQYGESAVRSASRVNDFELVRLLLDLGADEEPLCWTPLMRAIALGSHSEVERELGSGPDFAAVDHASRNAWFLAVATGDCAKTAPVLGRTGDVNERGWFDATPLHTAVVRDRPGMVEWLAARGADIEAVNRMGHTPLITAAQYGSVGCARALARLGANVNAGPNRYRAVSVLSSVDTLRALCELGAEINVVDAEGGFPLKDAATDDDLDRVAFLLSHGAKVDLTSTGETALHAATRANALEVMETLLKAGANPNARDVDRDTPLSYRKTREAVDLLLRYGADDSLHGAQSSWDLGE